MARYDGLIIPRSYSEYINKTDAATHAQAHQLSGVLDSAPTEDSVNAVKSGGVFDALAGKQPILTFDNVPTEDSDNPVKSGGIYDALETKQDALTFDDTPTADSDNPVKSKGLVNSVPVDEVTKNNMHAVTSNAVAEALVFVVPFSKQVLSGSYTVFADTDFPDYPVADYDLVNLSFKYVSSVDNASCIAYSVQDQPGSHTRNIYLRAGTGQLTTGVTVNGFAMFKKKTT